MTDPAVATPADSVTAAITVERETFTLDAALTVKRGRTLAIVGPNGAGKSSLAGALAGFVECATGRITVGERVLTDVAAGIDVPMEQRRVGMVFQNYLLFPHLSVLENVAFGPRSTRTVTRRDATASAREWLERLGISELADARPAALSGGQAQRVAVARALAGNPELLVLDEPLAALDVEVRDEVRASMTSYLSSFSGFTVLITHDLEDVRALADDIVVIEGGRIRQRGTLSQLEAAPASAYVARLVSRGA